MTGLSASRILMSIDILSEQDGFRIFQGLHKPPKSRRKVDQKKREAAERRERERERELQAEFERIRAQQADAISPASLERERERDLQVERMRAQQIDRAKASVR